MKHLTLTELLAWRDRGKASDRAREHLETCPRCRELLADHRALEASFPSVAPAASRPPTAAGPGLSRRMGTSIPKWSRSVQRALVRATGPAGDHPGYEEIVAHLADSLSPEESRRMAAHLRACDACRVTFLKLRRRHAESPGDYTPSSEAVARASRVLRSSPTSAERQLGALVLHLTTGLGRLVREARDGLLSPRELLRGFKPAPGTLAAESPPVVSDVAALHEDAEPDDLRETLDAAAGRDDEELDDSADSAATDNEELEVAALERDTEMLEAPVHRFESDAVGIGGPARSPVELTAGPHHILLTIEGRPRKPLVRVQVLDRDSGHPVPGVRLVLRPPEDRDDLPTRTRTDRDGRAVLPVALDRSRLLIGDDRPWELRLHLIG